MPAFTVTVLAAVRLESPARVRVAPPNFTKEPAPARPEAKVTSPFGVSSVKVRPAATGASAPEMSVK